MANGQYGELRSFLKEIELNGFGVVRLKKLLWMLGRSNSTASVWQEVLGQWTELGNDRNALRAAEFWDGTLLLTTLKMDAVADWAK